MPAEGETRKGGNEEDLFILISVERLNLQLSPLKKKKGNDCVVVKREGEDLYFLLLLFKSFAMLATVFQHLFRPLNFLIGGSGEHPQLQQ